MPEVPEVPKVPVRNSHAFRHREAPQAPQAPLTLLNPSADRQAARHARRNRTIERAIVQRAEKRDQILIVVIDTPQAPEERIEILAADVHVPVTAAPVIHIVIESSDYCA